MTRPLQPVYHFGVQPMRSTRRLWARYQPLLDEINAAASGFRLTLESALSEQVYYEKIQAGLLDIVIVEPHMVLDAERVGYKVFARTGRQDRISGLVVVRADSKIQKIPDLSGKTICFSRPDSLGSTMLVRKLLWEYSFPLQKARQIVYAGSQESAVLQVYLKAADAAGVSAAAWQAFQEQNPHMVDELKVRWHTEELSGPAVMAHNRVPEPHVRQIVEALEKITKSKPGLSAMHQAGFSEFHSGGAASYDDVWAFVQEYRRLFGYEKSGAF